MTTPGDGGTRPMSDAGVPIGVDSGPGSAGDGGSTPPPDSMDGCGVASVAHRAPTSGLALLGLALLALVRRRR